MPRFFIPPTHISNGKFTLAGTEAHHAIHVMRHKAGDVIDLFDGKDTLFQARIDRIQGDAVQGTILEEMRADSPLGPVQVNLYQGLSTGAKWDWLVEKAVEIGVSRIIPISTVRTIVKLSQFHTNEKFMRWQRIALAASKQCGRGDVVKVEAPISFVKALTLPSPGSLSLIPWEKEDHWSIQQASKHFSGTEVNVFVGPEGGWDSEEIGWSREKGVIAVRLGPTLLRTETAGLVALTLVLRELGVY